MNRTYKISPRPQESERDGDHLSIEVLDAYHGGRLDAIEKADVQRHLLFCQECQDTLLDLAQFLKDSRTPSRLWSAELTAAWEEWQAARDENR
jgi:hypothetical protein